MNVIPAVDKHKKEKVSVLKTVAIGRVIRFQHDSFGDALVDNLFYIVCKNSNNRVKLVNPVNGEILERDEDWRVIEHESELSISPNL